MPKTTLELRLLFSRLLREYRKTRSQILEQGREFENALDPTLRAVCGSPEEFLSILWLCKPQYFIEVMKVADDTGVFAARIIAYYGVQVDRAVLGEASRVIETAESSVGVRISRSLSLYYYDTTLTVRESVTAGFGGKGALIYAIRNRPSELAELLSDPTYQWYTAHVIFWLRIFASRELLDRAVGVLHWAPYPHRQAA